MLSYYLDSSRVYHQVSRVSNMRPGESLLLILTIFQWFNLDLLQVILSAVERVTKLWALVSQIINKTTIIHILNIEFLESKWFEYLHEFYD